MTMKKVQSKGSKAENPTKDFTIDTLKKTENTNEKLQRVNTEQCHTRLGKLPSGITFKVPKTHDMVTQLLYPTVSKNLTDMVILSILALHIWFWFKCEPGPTKSVTWVLIFCFWRISYNFGIGYLLRIQSTSQQLVKWAKHSKIFSRPPLAPDQGWLRLTLYSLIRWELESYVVGDYSFENMNLEFNTWLVFRRVVDLILMCDFTSYCLFAVAEFHHPIGEHILLTTCRWVCGITIILVNLWVKMDAHRVVQDYAWYWGDFFFLIDQKLQFNGVFEMAPHPMYSVGYTWLYGLSLLAASPEVFFVSVATHASQFAFLSFVENPHIEITYHSPKKTKSLYSHSKTEGTTVNTSCNTIKEISDLSVSQQSPSLHNLLSIQNIDFHRTTDLTAFLLIAYMMFFTFLTPSSYNVKLFFALNALAWRFWFSLGIGFILFKQSREKSWTRHYIKRGEGIEEAWRAWRGLYYISTVMLYSSYAAAACKFYNSASQWSNGPFLFRLVFGALLIGMQIWTSKSIYETLGEFGWFFGDFFFENSTTLSYEGIYRFWNNPEQFLGLAGVWGIAFISWNPVIYGLAFISHVATLMFIEFVEQPHLRKLHGESVRRDSGFSKGVHKSLPKAVREVQGKLERIISEAIDAVEDVVETTSPRVKAEVETLVKESSTLLQLYSHKIYKFLEQREEEFAIANSMLYSVKTGIISNETTVSLNNTDSITEKGQFLECQEFEFGTPIRVQWTAPFLHNKKDWIGIYAYKENRSREITQTPSQGRWIAVCRGAYTDSRAEEGIIKEGEMVKARQIENHSEDENNSTEERVVEGEVEFRSGKLWWSTGVYELRYHHAGKQNVLAVSLPIRIVIRKFDKQELRLLNEVSAMSAIAPIIVNLLEKCCNGDLKKFPRNFEDEFGLEFLGNEIIKRRLLYAVHQVFDVEFAPDIFFRDFYLYCFVRRIYNAMMLLHSSELWKLKR